MRMGQDTAEDLERGRRGWREGPRRRGQGHGWRRIVSTLHRAFRGLRRSMGEHFHAGCRLLNCAASQDSSVPRRGSCLHRTLVADPLSPRFADARPVSGVHSPLWLQRGWVPVRNGPLLRHLRILIELSLTELNPPVLAACCASLLHVGPKC
jgi:hypothetical protein